MLEGVAVAGLLGLVGLYAASPIYSIDFHWHLAIGRVIDERGAIPRVDLFSAVESERPYVQFNWLWDWLAFRVHELGGLRAIRAMQGLSMVASFAVLYVALRRALARPSLALAVSALALLLFEDRFRARPDALTLGFVACMLPWLLERSRAATVARLVAWLALAAVWSNLHGGASLLLVLSAGALAVGATVNARLGPGRTQLRDAWLWLATGAVGIALSPVLLPGLAHWAEAIGPQMATGNEEWLPSWTMLRNGSTPSFVTIALGPTAVAITYAVVEARRVRREGWRSADVAEWLLAGGYLVLAHQAVRNAFLCVVPVAFLLQRVPLAAWRPTHARVAVLAALFFGAASFHDNVVGGYGGVANAAELLDYDLAPDTYPEEASAFIAAAGIEGGILNDGTWGGYLVWHNWPACGVFVDTRHHLTPEMWPVFLRSHRSLDRERAMEEAFARWGVELALFRAPTFPLIVPPPEWQLLYKAGDQELYQRLGGAHAAENLERARAELLRRGVDPIPDGDRAALARGAQDVGGYDWLTARYQRRREARAHRALASEVATERVRGHRIRADLWFRAGVYEQALWNLESLLDLAPDDAPSRARAALAHYVLGRPERARTHLAAFTPAQAAALPAVERGRLMLLERALHQSDHERPSDGR